MNKIKTSELKAGMKFNKPVYIDGNNLLVPPNIPLKQKDIDRLIRWEINEVETDGSIIQEISKPLKLDDIDIEISEIVKIEDSLYTKWINQLEEIFNDIKKKRASLAGSDHQLLDSISKELLNEIENNPQTIFQSIIHSEEDEKMFSMSGVNCACISAVIGKNSKLPQFRIMQLIIASLLHDSGMFRISDEVITKKERLTPDELKKIQMHTIYSYQIILQELKYPEDAAIMVLYHHERWDGTGYPKNIKGDAIPVGSRIIAVADAYEAMLNQRPYRDALIGYNAMKNILSDNGTHFDPAILKIFLQCIGVYPIGSFVLLNNSMVGKVVSVNNNSPMRPQIRLLFDENGKRIKDKTKIDLLSRKKLFIIKAIDPRELSLKELSQDSIPEGAIPGDSPGE
ncbi:MAG: HD-GYP domain-containing protein [Spirochaetales bacterium]|nr:HD-GYP domain-containing protein [Spirochaetales bacterium]